MRRIYLAGPEVFLPNARELGDAKKAICTEHGFLGRYPLDAASNGAPAPALAPTDGHTIFRHCIEMMEGCDLIVANMTPFRGPSMDVGTAVEIGFMFALGRPVFGYTNVVDDYALRVTADGWQIEEFGFADNLMCEGPVFESGGSIVRTGVADDVRLTDLRGFEACVAAAAELIGSNE
jgi:nucleoside 2-deoxyribosyltransferase